jgi:hypothetical protein
MIKNSEALLDMFAPPPKKPTSDGKQYADELRQAAHKIIREDLENRLPAWEYPFGPWAPFEAVVKKM